MVIKRKYDIIFLGASGFTGNFILEHVANMFKNFTTEPFTWAVAGRSSTKLKKVLDDVSNYTGYNIRTIDILEVDVTNEISLRNMARKGAVVANIVGPYIFYGEPVVKACIAEGTHHIDLSEEPQFVEKIEMLYHKEAEKKGVYIVGTCGFDSIPAEIGINFLNQKFKGDLNSVEAFMAFDPKAASSPIHYSTWEGAVNVLASLKELDPIRSHLFKKQFPKPKFPVKEHGMLHYSDSVKAWCIPRIGTDITVMRRTQYQFLEQGKRPFQYSIYSPQDNLFVALLFLFVISFIKIFAKFKLGFYCLLKFPRFFSFGVFTHEGPTREQADFPFALTIIGDGWKQKLAEPSDQHATKPDKRMTVKVCGRNPGYGTTCICLIQSALTVLREASKMPSTGGVYTPGAAFAETSIADRLNKAGLTFQVVEE